MKTRKERLNQNLIFVELKQNHKKYTSTKQDLKKGRK